MVTGGIKTLLIANRGEIACRIIETARRMGVETVAIYSDVDAGARHVGMADRAVAVGGALAGEGYLNASEVLRAAAEAEADAIHPGYGFLSENPDFVARVEAAGLIFVGPSSGVVRDMGLKDRAKALMERAGVPVVPGYHGTDQDDETLAAAAAEIGYPVLIKAVAGGGGKGMRAVLSPDAFAAALAGARSEALAAFGNADVLIEKMIERPRHIEIQIFGDGTRAVHLFERDCSLQRRHQKVLEEAPAPGMPQEMRDAMGRAAVQAAEAIGYRGAGTVEFIVDASDGLRPDRFWFMEMNTRLQVEHPVTEAITGVDLVEWQLRVAGGEALPLSKDDLTIAGHAVEVRLYAEDPANGFLPATGRLDYLVFSGSARVDTGVVAGDRISQHYDPLIAKLTVHAKDRARALETMQKALEETEIAGTRTNLRFLENLVTHADVRHGNVDTGLIARDAGRLVEEPPATIEARAIAVASVLAPGAGRGFSLWGALKHCVSIDGDLVTVICEAGQVRYLAPEREVVVESQGDVWVVDGQPSPLRSFVSQSSVTVFGPGGGSFLIDDPLDRRTSVETPGQVIAPMPGRLTRLFVQSGDVVQAGQPLAIVEAMKMEHTLTAALAGVVAELQAFEGAQIEAGVVLCRIDAPGAGS